MSPRPLVVTLMGLVVVPMALGQQPPDRNEDLARRRATLELRELEHRVDQALLEESLLLLRRTQRDRQINQGGPAEKRNELETLDVYVDKLKAQFLNS